VKKFYIAEGPKLNFDCSNLDTSIENMADRNKSDFLFTVKTRIYEDLFNSGFARTEYLLQFLLVYKNPALSKTASMSFPGTMKAFAQS
jgi:hypothetical protein